MLSEKIRDLQLTAKGAAAMVADQLIDMAEDMSAAEQAIVEEDLNDNTLNDIEKKIAEYAKAHKSGNCGVCPPKEAERIIREHFGLLEKKKDKKINLLDFM